MREDIYLRTALGRGAGELAVAFRQIRHPRHALLQEPGRAPGNDEGKSCAANGREDKANEGSERMRGCDYEERLRLTRSALAVHLGLFAVAELVSIALTREILNLTHKAQSHSIKLVPVTC